VDSHLTLPVIKDDLLTLNETDFKVLQSISNAPCAMMAHALYEAIDDKHISTFSSTLINYVKTTLNVNSVIFSDDILMKAINGPLDMIALNALNAGIDVVLHCSGKLEEEKSIAKKLQENDKRFSEELYNKIIQR
jgi:beta-glucosidase-like glycosyl hydrolase